jgi:hypothetical protein
MVQLVLANAGDELEYLNRDIYFCLSMNERNV